MSSSPSSSQSDEDNSWIRHCLEYVVTPAKKPKLEQVVFGPKYPRKEDSFVLHQPSDEFHAEHNLRGFVPVVVDPQLVKGIGPKEVHLTDIQKEGIRFMWNCYMNKEGCILAHEMGLGKTRSAIVLILTALEQCNQVQERSCPGANRVIIIAPKNALPCWEEEFKKWVPRSLQYLERQVLRSNQTKSQVSKTFKEFTGSQTPQAESRILLLSYNAFAKNASEIQNFSSEGKNIDLVICDEAQLLKNDNTSRSKDIRNKFKVFQESTVWIGLTGTPYQNNLVEYANLVEFFRPETLKPNYKQKICRPIMSAYKTNSKLDNETHELLVGLRKSTCHVIQYKTNVDLNVESNEIILCLPLNPGPRATRIESCFMDLQHRLYHELCQDPTPMKFLHVCNRLDLLTKLCIHPLYAIESYPDLSEFALYQKEIDNMRKRPEIARLASRKICLVVSMLREILTSSNEGKVVVASSSNYLLDMLEAVLKREQYPIGPILRYDGRTLEHERKHILIDFKEKPSHRILLLGSKAGGTALTLTSANHMFVLDPDWNPANDRQIMGRLIRHGQKRQVYIYRIVCTGTIEEIKFMNQLNKDELKKFFENDPSISGDKKLQSTSAKVLIPFGANELFEYYPETKSRIHDLLEETKKQTHDADCEFEVLRFAEGLADHSDKYQEPSQVPAALCALHTVWNADSSLISFVFHQNNSRDLLSEVLFHSD